MAQLIITALAAFIAGVGVSSMIIGLHQRTALRRAEALGFKKGELAAWQESTRRLREASQ